MQTSATPTPASLATRPTTEGGSLVLSSQGQSITIALDSANVTNTDEGYPDFVELGGPDTFLAARIDPKMPDGEDGDAYYQPVVGRAFPMDVPLDLLETPREISVPGQGKYAVIGGSITMDAFQRAPERRAFWQGRIEVIIQTSQGPITLPGTFDICIVPTW